MRNNTLFRMQDIFMNPQLRGVFPQFDRIPAHHVYSFAEVERRIVEYLQGALGGATEGRSELVVRGKHSQVLRQVQGLTDALEALFNAMPSVAKGLRANTPLYLPYATLAQIGGLETIHKKTQAMRAVLDNLRFNPDFQSCKATSSEFSQDYLRKQAAWKLKVGYKE